MLNSRGSTMYSFENKSSHLLALSHEGHDFNFSYINCRWDITLGYFNLDFFALNKNDIVWIHFSFIHTLLHLLCFITVLMLVFCVKYPWLKPSPQLPEAHPDSQRPPSHSHAASLLWPPRPLPHQPSGLWGQTLVHTGAISERTV